MIAAIMRKLGLGTTRRDNSRDVVLARLSRALRAKYDAALTTPDNQRHWASADALSADAANSADVRRIIRKRARYEVANNPTLAGIVKTLTNDTIGTGPRLQVRLGTDRQTARQIELAFADWARSVRLAAKLWTLRHARAVDGESFAMIRTNPRLPGLVKLDIHPIEADRVADAGIFSLDPTFVDGIKLDDLGNPVSYTVLRDHPGQLISLRIGDHGTVQAENMLHWFAPTRPEQHRGVCEFVSSLPLGAHLRRYASATLSAAELIAILSTFIETDGPGDDSSDPTGPEYFDEMRLGHNLLMTVPKDSKPMQAKPEQPASTFRDFHSANVGMMARPLCMTYSLAAGDFSRTTFSASRMEDRNYGASIDIDREMIEAPNLSRIFAAWFAEAKLIAGVLPEAARSYAMVPHEWAWDSRPHVDPGKVATARATDLRSGATTLTDVYAEQGRDFLDELPTLLSEVEALNQHGLAHPFQVQPGAGDNATTTNEEPQPTDDGDPNADAA